jgi:hypothetical protein
MRSKTILILIVKMASVAMILFGLDPGNFVCFIVGKYTGHHQDVCCTLNAVQYYITPDDYEHTKQILLDECPAQLTFMVPEAL